MMTDKSLGNILQDLAEKGAPAQEIDLRKRIRGQLEGVVQGNMRQKRLLWQLGTAAAVITLATTLLGVMPQGRAWAEELIHFFIHEGGDNMATTEPLGTYAEVENLDEVQKMVEYDLLAPAILPAGYILTDIFLNPESGEVVQLYKYQPYQSGEFFLLSQAPTREEVMIGSSASVENLVIGSSAVEYVSGQWFGEDGSMTTQWIQDMPVHTFRWQAGETTMTLQFWVNETFSPAYLDRETMLEVVEVVMGLRNAYSETLNLDHLTSIEEAEIAAGGNVLAPEVLPEGYAFSFAAYEPGERMTLIYETADGQRLVIFETTIAPDLGNIPTEAIQRCAIGEIEGIYVRGSMLDGVYDPDLPGSLYFEKDGTHIGIHPRNATLGMEVLIHIAENME